jgi:hypothetical protein
MNQCELPHGKDEYTTEPKVTVRLDVLLVRFENRFENRFEDGFYLHNIYINIFRLAITVT